MTAWHQYTTRTMIGPLSAPMARNLGFSVQGCPYRGSLVCLKCYFAPPIVCHYRCIKKSNGGRNVKRIDCAERYRCRCGHDQTERLKAWGLI